jgi:hypothetical protein
MKRPLEVRTLLFDIQQALKRLKREVDALFGDAET